MKLHTTEAEVGIRLDKLLADRLSTQSRSYWQTLIANGNVTVNKTSQPSKYLVKIGDVIEIDQKMVNGQPEINRNYDLNIPIIFENDDCLVINKPAGIVTHPAHAQSEVTIAEWAANLRSEIGNAIYDTSNPVSISRAGIVHRLDKNTSGVMIIAKNAEAMTFLAKQIQSHKVTKKYLALLYGHLDKSPLTIHNWLGRSTRDRRQMAEVDEGQGREAETIFTIKRILTSIKGDKTTLVEAQPITGRTHQIRVHAKISGHPVLGDEVYGSPDSMTLSSKIGLHRQWLHAESLTILLPKHNKPTTFIAPLPLALEQALKQFKSK